jgi:hypothetical protein
MARRCVLLLLLLLMIRRLDSVPRSVMPGPVLHAFAPVPLPLSCLVLGHRAPMMRRRRWGWRRRRIFIGYHIATTVLPLQRRTALALVLTARRALQLSFGLLLLLLLLLLLPPRRVYLAHTHYTSQRRPRPIRYGRHGPSATASRRHGAAVLASRGARVEPQQQQQSNSSHGHGTQPHTAPRTARRQQHARQRQ